MKHVISLLFSAAQSLCNATLVFTFLLYCYNYIIFIKALQVFNCCLTHKIQKIDKQNTKKSTLCNKKASRFNSKRLLLVTLIYRNSEHHKYHLKGVCLNSQTCCYTAHILLMVVRLCVHTVLFV